MDTGDGHHNMVGRWAGVDRTAGGQAGSRVAAQGDGRLEDRSCGRAGYQAMPHEGFAGMEEGAMAGKAGGRAEPVGCHLHDVVFPCTCRRIQDYLQQQHS
jgi:hypothetical protein